MITRNDAHLTYCTNIHPAFGWDGLFQSIQRFGPSLKERLSPESAFCIGLALSNAQAETLLTDGNLQAFKRYLDDHGLYVTSINGFVFQEFHTPQIKAEIHQPDWRFPERIAYTKRMIEILAHLLPDHIGAGGISSQPLSYKFLDGVRLNKDMQWGTITDNLIDIVAHLVRTREQTGKLIHIDIEPEPDCLLETSQEVVDFYQSCLFTDGVDKLASTLNCSAEEAKQHILNHVRLCLDTCHVALAYESIETVLEACAKIGIKIGRLQISSALKVTLGDAPDRERLSTWLQQFAEDKFLHQVTQKNRDGSITQYRDLKDALPLIGDADAEEWRVHFHVPIFIGQYTAGVTTTQAHIKEALDLFAQQNYTAILEVETYTWDVLPPDLRVDMLDSIERELNWVDACLK